MDAARRLQPQRTCPAGDAVMLAGRMRMAAAGVSAGAPDWWVVAGKTCVAAYQPIGAASLAASYTNLANPGTYDAAPGTAPTWDASGWTFTRISSQYLTTGIIPATGWSMLLRFSDTSGIGNQWAVGVDSASNARFYISPTFSVTQRVYGGGRFVIITGALSSGVMGIANNQPYLNGVTDGAAVAAWSATQTKQILIGSLNQAAGGDPNPIFYWNGKIQALAIYSDTLSGAEVATLSAAMAALT